MAQGDKLSAAAELAKLRWANTTAEERSAHGRYMRSCYKPVSKKAGKVVKNPVGRPRKAA